MDEYISIRAGGGDDTNLLDKIMQDRKDEAGERSFGEGDAVYHSEIKLMGLLEQINRFLKKCDITLAISTDTLVEILETQQNSDNVKKALIDLIDILVRGQKSKQLDMRVDEAGVPV